MYIGIPMGVQLKWSYISLNGFACLRVHAVHANVGKGCWFANSSTKEPSTEDSVCLQDTHDQHEDEYRKELKALQAKYDALYGECYMLLCPSLQYLDRSTWISPIQYCQ